MIRRILLLSFLPLVLSLAFGCSSSDSKSPVPGDADPDPEQEARCEENALGCKDSRTVIACQNGAWRDLDTCPEDKHCERGICVITPIDGDVGVDGDGEPDSDIEPPPDTEAPYIVSSRPESGATNVSTELDEIRITFNEPLDTSNLVINRDILVYGCALATTLGNISQDKTYILISLLEDLTPGTRYTVAIAPDRLADMAGNPFPGASFSFTTSGDADGDGDCDYEPGDFTSPELSDSFPYDGQVNVPTSQSFVLMTFSEVLDTADYDLNAGLSVRGEPSHEPAISAAWQDDNSGFRLKITLEEALHEDTLYTVTLDEGLTDHAGNPLGKVEISFDTGAGVADGDVEQEPSTDGDGETIDGDTDDPPPNTGQYLESSRSSCLAGGDEDIELDASANQPYLSAESVPDLDVTGAYRLTITHHNAAYDSGLNSITAPGAYQDGRSIVIQEMKHISVPSGAVCLFDITHVFDSLLPARYTVQVTHADDQSGERTLEIAVDVPENK